MRNGLENKNWFEPGLTWPDFHWRYILPYQTFSLSKEINYFIISHRSKSGSWEKEQKCWDVKLFSPYYAVILQNETVTVSVRVIRWERYLCYHSCVCVCVVPLRRVSVQLRRMSAGRLASSKANGPALGFRSLSTAVMLMPLGSGLSHTSISWGETRGALSLISNR